VKREALGVLLALGAAAGPAAAEPLRLRGDALATAQSPTGLLVLEGDDRARPWLRAEGLVWVGTGDEDEADALVINVRLTDPGGRAVLRLGRQVVTSGGLRPLHLDGAHGLVRLPWGFGVEAFGGLPLAADAGPRAWDWVVGARLSRALGGGRVGLAWMQRRDHGALDAHELAVDASTSPTDNVDVAGGAALDLVDRDGVGLAEVQLSAAWRSGGRRLEIFAQHREPSRLLPATSLFTVLGDVPAQRMGLAGRWRAAPRLDLRAMLAVRVAGDETGLDASTDARLRLDDRGDGVLSLELRREFAPGGGWSGVRTTGRKGVGPRLGGGRLAASAELELVVPDEPDGRGEVWPWGLVALSWRRGPWELAGAVEASASPSDEYRVDGLFRLTRAWGDL
jgi:hypothetical protein